MWRFAFFWIVVVLATVRAVRAAPPAPLVVDKNIGITALRKSGETVRTQGNVNTGAANVTNKELKYIITINNASLTDLAPTDLRYILFVNREKVGGKKDAIQRLKGKATVPLVKSRQKFSVETEDFHLTSGQLPSGWTYQDGGRGQAAETVKGVWVRLYRDGALVCEMVSPDTLPTKEEWRD